MRIITLFLLITILFGCKKSTPDPSPSPTPTPTPTVNNITIRGVDLSYTPEIRSFGTVYKYNNTAGDILDIIKARGINTVRLRLWYAPATVRSGLAEVISFATEIKNKGLSVFLDLHYSDTWADPGQQTKPLAWQSANLAGLKDSVYQYTKRVLQAFVAAGATPSIVQIGNETNGGLLWNEGRVGGSYDANWAEFANLLKKGIQAVKEVDPSIKTMIHYAGYSGAQQYFSNINTQGVSYDYIGLSYYPVFHGKDMDALASGMSSLVSSFNKPILIAETDYPFTLSWNDQTNNTVGLPDQLIPSYPATLSGQAAFLTALLKKVNALGTKGLGVCYWSPDLVAYKGTSSTTGSFMENQALFDFSNNAVPGLDSLGRAF